VLAGSHLHGEDGRSLDSTVLRVEGGRRVTVGIKEAEKERLWHRPMAATT
jgi:hypothetical protein